MVSFFVRLIDFKVLIFGLGACLNHYVDSYQTLNYRPVLDRRKKRSIDDAFDYYSADSTPVDIRFNSHNR